MSDASGTQFWVNGQPASGWPCDDRGLLYGDGVFESIAVHGGQLVCLDRHLARLERGCRALGFAPPDEETLKSDLAALTPALGASHYQHVRLSVTRGCGGHGYAPPAEVQPARLWALSDWPQDRLRWQQEGLVLAWLSLTLARQPALAGVKHLNRLEQVLAARELQTAHVDEGLLCDGHGYVIEAVSANLFVRHGQSLLTPDVSHCGVGGVARERVLAMASALGFTARVAELRRADVLAADEVFLTNALRGARPVARLGSVTWRHWPAARAVHNVLAGEVLLP